LFLKQILRILERGPQPAHAALGFFCGALGVELHQVGQDVVGARIGGQAVGGQHRGVELVVQLAQHAHQALGVDGFLFGRECAAFAQGGQHVVEAGEGEAGGLGGGPLSPALSRKGRGSGAAGTVPRGRL
jgi:hypothetical protein